MKHLKSSIRKVLKAKTEGKATTAENAGADGVNDGGIMFFNADEFGGAASGGAGEGGTGGEVFIIDVRVDDPCALRPLLLIKHVRYITIPTTAPTIPTPQNHASATPTIPITTTTTRSGGRSGHGGGGTRISGE